jgi:galactokinase
MNRTIQVDRLLQSGLSAVEAERKAELFGRASLALQSCSRPEPSEEASYFVPGRIEVLGKHTDYAGGRSLLCAIERGFCVVAFSRPDPRVKIADAVRHQECEFILADDLDTTIGDWSVYPKTVARRIARNFPGRLRGVDMAFANDLPSSAGLSSSSAFVVATFLALSDLNHLQRHPAYQDNIKTTEDLATYLGCIENGRTFGTLAGDAGVGTFGGSEDHTAILCCRAGRLTQFRFCPVRPEGVVELPSGCVFAVGVSGVVADKTGSAREKYNRASRTAATILDTWQAASGRKEPTLLDLVEHSPDAPQRIRQLLVQSLHRDFPSEGLLDRFEQFLAECTDIIPKAVAALARGDLEGFGILADKSQAGAERGLGNQVPETRELARLARALGAKGASAFGAGFGGAVWALIKSDRSDEFLVKWRRAYHERFPDRAGVSDFFPCRPGPSALRL